MNDVDELQLKMRLLPTVIPTAGGMTASDNILHIRAKCQGPRSKIHALTRENSAIHDHKGDLNMLYSSYNGYGRNSPAHLKVTETQGIRRHLFVGYVLKAKLYDMVVLVGDFLTKMTKLVEPERIML